MRKILFATSVLIIAACNLAAAQERIPLITGKAEISVTEGTFVCDFTISEMPRIANYQIRLNKGMNVLSFVRVSHDFALAYKKEEATYESQGYYFPDNTDEGRFMPGKLRVRYTGKYPVAADTLSNYTRTDWKGNIAFNGYSLRADGAQSCWYPVIYDIDNDILYDKVRYDIEITCRDAEVLYMNGSAPTEGPVTSFKSDSPYEMAIFMGNFAIRRSGDTYFLNPDINDAQIAEFSGFTEDFKAYYERKLSIPYKQAITYVNTTPTSRKNAWLFVSYPTIMNIGWGKYGLIGTFADEDEKLWMRQFIAHELAHYYFGFLRDFNSPIGDPLSEGFAEYSSILLARDLLGRQIYDGLVKKKLGRVGGAEPVPIGRVTDDTGYRIDRNTYVYEYVPLVFTALEKEVGESVMWEWMNRVLTAPTAFTDYGFIKGQFASVLGDEERAAVLFEKYLESPASLAEVEAVVRAD